MAQGGVSLPAGYTKLEYLESNGAQYIDTGFIPNQDTRVVIDFESLTTADSAIFGARTAYKKNDYTFWISTGQWLTNYYTGSTYIANPPVGGRMLVDKNKNVTTINGVVTTNTYGVFQAPVAMTICTKNENGTLDDRYAKLKIYSCRIYDNGELVRDYIPAMNASGEAGLYDLKNDVWYGFKGPKPFNKISLYLSERDVTVGDTTLHIQEINARSSSAVTSQITVNVAFSMSVSGTVQTGTITIRRNSMHSMNAVPAGRPQSYYITSITPTEDDTYFYTF